MMPENNDSAQASIIPGTIGQRSVCRQFKDGTIEQRFLYYRSPEWKGQKHPRLRRVYSGAF